MKRITTLAGTLLLIWLFCTPILVFYTYFKINEYLDVYFFAYLFLTYLTIGIVFYYISNFFGGAFLKEHKPVILDSMPTRLNPPWYVSILYIVALIPFLFIKYIVSYGTYSPILGVVLGVIIFVLVCSANWYSPFRKKVNYWLTLQENEALAHAWAEPILYALNGLFVFVSVILITLGFLFYVGGKTHLTVFVCEDGSSFSVILQNPTQLEIISNDAGPSIFTQEEKASAEITTYGNESYAYTFVEGYAGQVIFTKRKIEGPSSTICHQN
jgi:hypothetical protein